MGIAKSHRIEAEERGWYDPEKSVCPDCVEDDYLKSEIQASASNNICDYCGAKSADPIAAPTESIMTHVAAAFFSEYADPSMASVPYAEGEYLFSGAMTDTGDALMSLPLECHDDLFEDITGSFLNDLWYPCANGHWADVSGHQELRFGWERFEETTKHKSRYFFPKIGGAVEPGERYSPGDILAAIGALVKKNHLTSVVKSQTNFYRVREIAQSKTLVEYSEIGPPPNRLAAAGRMNPAGISYFYTGLDEPTALAEVLERPPCRAAIGVFEPNKELPVLDLTNLPPVPSVFDSSKRLERDGLLFLYEFVDVVAKPIAKDGNEHVDYVPTQIVCEYFAQVFTTEDGKRLSGIIYPSTVRPVGKNIVIFPSRKVLVDWPDFIELRSISHKNFKVWTDLRVLTK